MLSNIWKAIFVLVSLDLFMTTLDLTFLEQEFEFSLFHWLIGLVATFALTLCNVYFIDIVKGENHRTSVFGYIWRTLISFNLALILAIILKILLGINLVLPSIQNTLVITSLQFLFIILITWLLYSTNRKGQLIWVSQTFRGA